MVISLSSETRMPFKAAELKPVIDRQSKPIVFYSYTLPSISRAPASPKSGVVVLYGLSHVAVALRQLVGQARFALPRGRGAGLHRAARSVASIWPRRLCPNTTARRCCAPPAWRCRMKFWSATRSQLDAAIARIGVPIAMKIQSREIPHKSEVGGVSVGIASRADALAAYDALLASARTHRPEAAIQGVLVAPMAKAASRSSSARCAIRPSGRW